MSRILSALLALSTAAPALAADSTGVSGPVYLVEVNSVNADTYLQYHGRVLLNLNGTLAEYRWGGTSCSNKTLPESQVTMLQRALESGSIVVPRFDLGQGSNRCLVGFGVRL